MILIDILSKSGPWNRLEFVFISKEWRVKQKQYLQGVLDSKHFLEAANSSMMWIWTHSPIYYRTQLSTNSPKIQTWRSELFQWELCTSPSILQTQSRVNWLRSTHSNTELSFWSPQIRISVMERMVSTSRLRLWSVTVVFLVKMWYMYLKEKK